MRSAPPSDRHEVSKVEAVFGRQLAARESHGALVRFYAAPPRFHTTPCRHAHAPERLLHARTSRTSAADEISPHRHAVHSHPQKKHPHRLPDHARLTDFVTRL